MSRRRHPFIPAIGWALVVGLASVTPPAVLGDSSTGVGLPFAGVPHLDTVFHLLGYAILAALLVRASAVGSTTSSIRNVTATLVFAVFTAAAFGLCIEGVQAVLAYRDASFLDASVNLLGAAIGAGLMGWCHG